MELRYVYLTDPDHEPLTQGHIGLFINTREVSESVLCQKDWTRSMTADSKFSFRKTQHKNASLCPECLRLFKESDHPEAVALQRWMEPCR